MNVRYFSDGFAESRKKPTRSGVPWKDPANRKRLIVVIVALAFFLFFSSARAVGTFWTDYLWFDSLHFADIWTKLITTRIGLIVLFSLVAAGIMILNWFLADRHRPVMQVFGPQDEFPRRYQIAMVRRPWLIRIVISLVVGIFLGASMASRWHEWILLRNGSSFGVTDPNFSSDISFYMFKLPFYSIVVDWLFEAIILVLIITLFLQYANGAIRFSRVGERVVSSAKAHISGLCVVLAGLKAIDYWFQRFELSYSVRGAVQGATYTDVKAQLPVLTLMIAISALAGILFLINIRRRGWTLPLLVVVLWGGVYIFAGTFYPAFVQRFRVDPAEFSKEKPYIQNNIDATRHAFGLDNVEVQPFAYSDSVADAKTAVAENPEMIRNIRLLDPKVITSTFQRLQANLVYTKFANLDVGRYDVTLPDGTVEKTQVVLANRELNPDGIPQQSWEGRHVAYTHGYGAAVAGISGVTASGQPDFLLKDVPVATKGEQKDLEIEKPEVYFGEGFEEYSIVGSKRDEVNYLEADSETVATRYEGADGVKLKSVFRKFAFALRMNDPNLLLSSYITKDSKILFRRDIRSRVSEIAPFLSLDSNPYPVIANGRLFYILDAYTTSNRYPNAQTADITGLPAQSGLRHEFNYVRNSVKIVVDAYDGTVTFYAMDAAQYPDPLLAAYREALPDLFTDMQNMPQQIREHLRYPEDLFRVQTNMWGRYHLGDAQAFYEKTNGWDVAQNPPSQVVSASSVTEPRNDVIVLGGGAQAALTTQVRTKESRIDPYYTLMRLPGEEDVSYSLFRSFVPTSEDDSRKKLTAFMVAGSDPDEYGRLRVYEMPSDLQIPGPSLVNASIQQDQSISTAITQLNQNGSKVEFGQLSIVPLDRSLLYVRPLYVTAEGTNPIPELKGVIAVFGSQVVMKPTLREALESLFQGISVDTLETEDGSSGTVANQDHTQQNTEVAKSTTTSTSQFPGVTTPTGALSDQEKQKRIAEASQLLTQAEDALKSTGDLAEYQRLVREARNKLMEVESATAGVP